MKNLVVGIATLFVLALVPGCGDRADSGECPDIGGTWTITSHCEAAFVGAVTEVSQAGCSITDVSLWTDWSGTVSSSGALSMSGYGGSEFITCTGNASSSSISMSCDEGCNVTMSKGGVALDSGTRTCTSGGECSGLDCEHVADETVGACVGHCVDVSDCDAGYHCIVGDTIGLEASCFEDCATSSCASGYDCFEYDKGSFACLPLVWFD